MNPKTFLLLNLALGFYNVGTIWAHEIDIFRSWKLVVRSASMTCSVSTGTRFRIGRSRRLELRFAVAWPFF
jgi:hypothetical protein